MFLALVASVYNARKTYGNDPLAALANHAIDMVKQSRSPALELTDTELDTFFASSREWLDDAAAYAAVVAKANRAALLCAATASFSHKYPDEPGGGNVKTAQLSIARQFDVADGFKQPPTGFKLTRFRYLPSVDDYLESGTNAEDLGFERDDGGLDSGGGGDLVPVFNKDDNEEYNLTKDDVRNQVRRDRAAELNDEDFED